MVETETDKYVSGSDAYPITVSMNPLITHDYQSIADALKNKFFHFTYKPFSTTALPYPHLFPMDGGTYVDKNGNNIHINLTDWTFKLNGYTELRGKGESSVQKGYYKGYGTEKGVPMDEAIEILRANIIRTAEVINQSMDSLSQDLHGEYTALSSQFGQYQQSVDAQFVTTAEGITQNYSAIQVLQTGLGEAQNDINDLDINKGDKTVVDAHSTYITDTKAFIRTGLLWYESGTPIYGIAIGQVSDVTTEQGHEVMRRTGFYTTYTAEELAFYIGTSKVAYISNNKLYITEANVVDKMDLGRYTVDDISGKGLVFKWKG